MNSMNFAAFKSFNDSLLKSSNPLDRAVSIGVGILLINILFTEGITGVLRSASLVFKKLPGVNFILNRILDSEVKGAVKLLSSASSPDENAIQLIPIPPNGVDPIIVLEILTSLHKSESFAEEGKAFAYTYTSSTDMNALTSALNNSYALFSEKSGSGTLSHDELLEKAWSIYMHSNALNPTMYPSLRKFETEVVSMTAWMVNGDAQTAGSVTSGGTESILMAVKTYRDRARKLRPHITRPNMIASESIHPAFEKAAHYFDVEIIHVKMTADFRVDVEAVERAINRHTILLIGSASQYCHGVIDPIEALSQLALARGLPLHVDACFGGFMLPWLEKLGKKIPLWDFRVPGVTSISADIHKYGYSSKGASVILYKNAELRAFQYFAFAEWPGGLFGSPSMAGSRPGGMLASAWTAMVSMGQDGYLAHARSILATSETIIAGVTAIDGIRLLTQPDMTCIAIVSDDSRVNILALADAMERLGGWKMERQQKPDSLHISVLPQHARIVNKLLVDMAAAVEEVRANPALASQGTTGVYGMVAAIPDKTIIDDFIIKFFSALYTTSAGPGLVESYFLNKADL